MRQLLFAFVNRHNYYLNWSQVWRQHKSFVVGVIARAWCDPDSGPGTGRVIGLATAGWRFFTFYFQLGLASIVFFLLNLGSGGTGMQVAPAAPPEAADS